jgi:hypothetical protein
MIGEKYVWATWEKLIGDVRDTGLETHLTFMAAPIHSFRQEI